MRTRTVPRDVASIIAILCTLASSAVAQNGDPAAAGAQPAPLAPEVDRVLTRMEARRVSDLRAQVEWDLLNVVEEESQKKFGQIWFKDVEPVPKFKVQFERKILANRPTRMNDAWMFDGLWFTEVSETSRTVTRREIRREGDAYNPYKLGEGAFPVPFGQRKDDIAREFDVTFPAPDPREKDPPLPNTDRIRLTPRPTSSMHADYMYIDFWVQRDGDLDGLPVKVKAAQLKGTGELNSYLTLTFSKIELNAGFSANVFEVETPAGYETEQLRLAPPPGSE